MGVKPKVIFTCFAGRRKNMELLLLYTDKLHHMGLLDEMHIWDFSKKKSDEAWLKETFQPAALFKTCKYEYEPLPVEIEPEISKEIKFKGQKDAHVMLTGANNKTVAEISLGAYGNSCCFLRTDKQGKNMDARGGAVCDLTIWRRLGLKAFSSGTIEVSLDGKKILEGKANKKIEFPLRVHVAGWNGTDEIKWLADGDEEKGRMHPYARLFAVSNKNSWSEYYQHYTTQLYPDHIVIKSDDDITFIDIEAFGRFLEHRVENEHPILMFPSIVNNGMCAFHQQSKEYIADWEEEFPNEGCMGKLWGNGKLCAALHEYFVTNFESWVKKASGLTETIPIPIGERISINFFAILSKDLYVYQMLGHDDEREITVDITKKLERGHAINMNMTVAHMAFFRQRETGLDEYKILKLYRRLAKKVLGRDGVKIF